MKPDSPRPTPSLDEQALAPLMDRLRLANTRYAAGYPGDSARRQPVHTVYGGAHLFRADTAARLGGIARAALDRYAPDPGTLARVVGLPEDNVFAHTLRERVVAKLEREPVEDFRLDFEDGYGNRPDDEEDRDAVRAAGQVAAGLAEGTLPPYIGVRVKPFNDELRNRSARTLDLLVTALVEETGGRLPPNFVVTLPKITIPEQAAVFADLLAALEAKLGLEEGALVFEFMVELPQIILGADGRSPLPRVLQESRGRAIAAHFGTYDYTAASSITAAHQTMHHPSCDFARQMMQVAFAGTGLWLSDGSTNILPVPPHRDAEGQSTEAHESENRRVMHYAWRRHYDDVSESLRRGFYQGWDLHPAQLVTRYAAVFSFFLSGLDPAGERLRNFVDKAAQATLVGAVFDDAATGQGLLNYFLRGINCGAVTEAETMQRTGLTLEELRGRSFVKIMQARRA